MLSTGSSGSQGRAHHCHFGSISAPAPVLDVLVDTFVALSVAGLTDHHGQRTEDWMHDHLLSSPGSPHRYLMRLLP